METFMGAMALLLVGLIIGIVITSKYFLKRLDKVQAVSDKNLQLYKLSNEWLKAKQEGKSLAGFLTKLGYKSVAIYGMGITGERLLEELDNTDIDVKYSIDKNAKNIYTVANVLSPDETLEEVDAVIVTTIAYYDEIEEMLSKKLKCKIVPLDDLIYDM